MWTITVILYIINHLNGFFLLLSQMGVEEPLFIVCLSLFCSKYTKVLKCMCSERKTSKIKKCKKPVTFPVVLQGSSTRYESQQSQTTRILKVHDYARKLEYECTCALPFTRNPLESCSLYERCFASTYPRSPHDGHKCC